MRKRTLGGLIVVLLIALMLWSSLKEPGLNDLQVRFTEMHAVRNENNTGPVRRRYLVTVDDTLWSELKRYGDLMPYTKLGNTEVYFFHQGADLPSSLLLTDPPFGPVYADGMVARYEKNAMGQVSLLKEPAVK